MKLNRLQELEEVTVEQDNIISSLNIKIKKLNTEIDTWKARNDLQAKNSEQGLANAQKEQMEIVQRMNAQLEEHKNKIAEQEREINRVLTELENQKQLNSRSPSSEMKQIVEKLRQQLAEKDEQHKTLNKAMNDIKADMVELARTNLAAMTQDHSHEKKMQEIIDRTSAEYQDKIYSLSEEMVKVKKELKEKIKLMKS